MSITLGEVKDKVKKLTNEYSINAVVVVDTNANLKNIFLLRIVEFINLTLNKIYREYLVNATKEYSLYPTANMNPDGYAIVEHKSEDITYSYTGLRALYFEVDNNATVTIKSTTDGVETSVEHVITTKDTYLATRLEIDEADSIEVVFGGDYPYRIRNIGAYEQSFETVDRIPAYKKMMELPVPEDELEFNTVKIEDTNGNLLDFDYEILNNHILVPIDTIGNVIYSYFRTPAKLLENASDSATIDLSDIGLDCLCYHVASMCLQEVNNELSTLLYNKGELALSSLSQYTGELEPTKKILDVRGW